MGSSCGGRRGDRCGCGWLGRGPTEVLFGGIVAYFAMASGQSTVFAVMKVPTRDGIGLSEVAMSTYFSLSVSMECVYAWAPY